MGNRIVGSLIVGVVLLIGFIQTGHASIVITAVYRGVSVDGVVSSNSDIGDFVTEHLADFDFGSAYAELDSFVSDSQFRINGSAYEDTEWDGPLNDVEAYIFFEVSFKLEAPFAYTLGGELAGLSESEHYFLDVSLTGTAANINYHIWNDYRVLNEVGTINPGSYTFSVSAHPSVLGGLDGGWAEVYISNVVLSLVPSATPDGTHVPEPTALGIWTIFSLLGACFTGRRLCARR